MVRRILATLAIATLLCVGACSTSAVDVDACRQVEAARCRRAPDCSVSIEPPYRTSESDVNACIRFYDDACLHGLVAGSPPGPPALSACLTTIRTGACPSAVLTPESDPACSWLSTSSSTTTTSNGDAAEN